MDGPKMHQIPPYCPVIIIGAGPSGIAMGHAMKKRLGSNDFLIFERQGGPGGVWWTNKYPGIACDVPSIFYSFSFRPNVEARSMFASGSDLVKYFGGIPHEFGFADRLRFDTDVLEARWIEADQEWELTIQQLHPGMGDLSYEERSMQMEQSPDRVVVATAKVRTKCVISCVGGIVEPKKLPSNVPGWETFKGTLLHSSRWSPTVDVKDKNVIVVGAGASAAQIVPAIIKQPFEARSVLQVIRSAPWVHPKLSEPKWFSEWAPLVFGRIPGFAQLFRSFIFLMTELEYWRVFRVATASTKNRDQLEMEYLKHMRDSVPEEYHQVLTPDYQVGCKRRLFDAHWLNSLSDPKVTLTNAEVARIEPNGVVLRQDDHEILAPADVVVMAHGFDVGRWLHPLHVVGTSGQTLDDKWKERGGPSAYLGTAIDGFPNFFIVFGPNTATGHSSVLIAVESMITYVSQFVRLIVSGRVKRVEVKSKAMTVWTDGVQRLLRRSIWAKGGCNSWYIREGDGWNSTAYPRSQIDFWLRCCVPRWSDWTFEYAGAQAPFSVASLASYAGLFLMVAAAVIFLTRS